MITQMRGRGSQRIIFGLPGLRLAFFVAAIFPAGITAEEAMRRVPDFGVILTDDGVLSFTDLHPQRSDAALRSMIRSLQGSPVKTLVYEVAAGSQVMFYPTKVGSVWGWRQADAETDPAWIKRIPINRAAATNGLDAVRTAGSEAKAMGLYFMPGYRINDAHFAHDPQRNVLTGEFWVNNHSRLALGSSPIPGDALYQHLFDFTHDEVRAQCRAVIGEITERYADIMDGLQLDFMRHPVFFPAGTGSARAHLLTEMLANLRGQLDAAGRRVGRFLALSVRVPPTLATCEAVGVDIRTWMKRRLVDVVIPSPSITLSHDLPIDDFVALGRTSGARIFPALFPRTQFHWPMHESPTEASYRGTTGRDVSEAQVRGAVLNYRWMGAAGFELYNFNLPPEHIARGAFRALEEPRGAERAYAITPAYWAEREATFEYRKQIPAPLLSPAATRLSIVIGEDLANVKGGFAALRLGLHGIRPANQRWMIAVNGARIYTGNGDGLITRVEGRESRPSRLHPPPTQWYLQLALVDRSRFNKGRNEIAVQLESVRPHEKIQIVEAQVVVRDKAQ